MQDNKDFLGTEPVGKLLLKLSIPTVIAQLINMLYNIVDRIYIGHIPGNGSLALTGVGVCMPLIMIVSAFAALVSSGGAPRASIYMGKKKPESAEKILGGCFVLQILVSLILTVVLLVFGKNLLLAFGASENTLSYALDYMRIYAFGTLFVQVTLGMNAFITAQGFTTVSMISVLIGAIDTKCGTKIAAIVLAVCYSAGPFAALACALADFVPGVVICFGITLTAGGALANVGGSLVVNMYGRSSYNQAWRYLNTGAQLLKACCYAAIGVVTAMLGKYCYVCAVWGTVALIGLICMIVGKFSYREPPKQ